MPPLKGLSQPAAVSRLPRTIINRLLKSWAMPPLSWPTASLRCSELFLGFVQALLGLHSLGHVACDFGEPYNLAVVIANCI
jgi:hypothetical protein